MKLKKWLREYKQMSFEEYKALQETEVYLIQAEHREFCRKENLRKQVHDKQGWRPMTEEEKARTVEILAKEKERYEKSQKAGGIDERGNYTALHHR